MMPTLFRTFPKYIQLTISVYRKRARITLMILLTIRWPSLSIYLLSQNWNPLTRTALGE